MTTIFLNFFALFRQWNLKSNQIYRLSQLNKVPSHNFCNITYMHSSLVPQVNVHAQKLIARRVVIYNPPWLVDLFLGSAKDRVQEPV